MAPENRGRGLNEHADLEPENPCRTAGPWGRGPKSDPNGPSKEGPQGPPLSGGPDGPSPAPGDTERVLDAFQHEGSGPQMSLRSYLTGETKTFEYVVGAVAHYYGGQPDEWRVAAHQALDLYCAEVSES